MGSGDLNMKKSWHPQRSGNLAATAKAESEAIAERKKMQQRLHEIEEERRKEEIQKALEAAGGKRKLDRVEWMYAGPTDGQIGDAAESEAYLLGKRRIDKLLQDNEIKKLQKRPDLEQASIAPIIANARDVATKIREDPLLAIKRQEQQAYEAAMNDPIKRRQLLASMEIGDSQHRSKQKEERHRHRHHHRSHRRHDDDRDGDKHSRRRSFDSRERSRTPKRRDSDGEDRRRRRRDSPDRRRKDSPERRRHRSSSEEERDSRPKRDEDRARQHHDRRPRDVSGSRSPAPRKARDYSRERDDRPQLRDQDERNDYRSESKNENRYADRNDRSFRPRKENREENREENRSRPNGGPRPSIANNDSDRKEAAEQERARKLAAMQEAARDLDHSRKQRLAAIEEADRKAKEEDGRVRQRNKKYGGDAMFTNVLHNRAAEIKISERMERAR